MKKFLVGGMVRDEIMGLPSKDADFTVVLDESDIPDQSLMVNKVDLFTVMRDRLVGEGFKIFLETPEHFTIRAQFPKGDNPFGVRDADFVLAREEGPYSDGRRPDWVRAGDLGVDLARRDFSCNAIAKAADGSLIDPFNGIQDIKDRVLRAVGNAFDRLNEDALRALRALRFSVTKGFRIDHELAFAMEAAAVVHKIENKISDERIREELNKMFQFNTVASIKAMNRFPLLTAAVFSGTVSLDATMKTKGRGR
jgi:tRNA nucleotidyltransferase (CCA-adding enzyme)